MKACFVPSAAGRMAERIVGVKFIDENKVRLRKTDQAPSSDRVGLSNRDEVLASSLY